MSVVKPLYTHSIVNVKANETMPEMLLRKLCTEYPSYVGLVVREPSKLEVEKFLELDADPEVRFQKINRINSNTKKFPRQFIFGAFPAEFDEDEGQPWTIIKDSKGNRMLTVACEGDFPGRESAEGYSEAFVVVNEYLGPKLEEFYKLAGNTPSKLFDYLSSTSFKKDLDNLQGFRAGFAFMPTVGEPIMLGNFREEGKGGSDYSWGSCTFNHGYSDPVIAAATAEPAKPKKGTIASKYDDDVIVEPAKPLAPVPSVPQVIPATPKDPIAKVATELVSNEAVRWAPPAGVHGKGLKKAYRDMLGHLPDNWQQRPSFMIKAKDDPAPAAAPAKPKDMKEEAPKPVLPVIDGNQQAKAVDFIKKFLGDGSTVIDEHPLETQKQEANLAVFSELCLKSGKLEEINRWPVSGIFAFCKENPQVAALLLIELRRDRINRMTSVKDADKPLGELTGTVIQPVVVPPPIPSPEPAELPAPRRAAGGSSRYD